MLKVIKRTSFSGKETIFGEVCKKKKRKTSGASGMEAAETNTDKENPEVKKEDLAFMEAINKFNLEAVKEAVSKGCNPRQLRWGTAG